MMSTFRDVRSARRSFSIGILLLSAMLAAGCSSGDSPGAQDEPMIHTDASGQSVAGWLVLPSGGEHARVATLDFIDTGLQSSCGECHGGTLSGGISRVSCYQNPAGCHHGPIPDWPAPQVHGEVAKRAPESSGFRSCQICHGIGFAGGGSGVDCFDCHTVNAPHPQRPWIGTGVTHIDTDERNVPVCAQCHTAGSPFNPGGHPFEPAVEGSEPGCYNNTLCHGFYELRLFRAGAAATR